MARVLFWQALDAGGAIAPRRIARMGDSDRHVLQAAGVGHPLVGIAGRARGKEDERVEIARIGIAEVEYGAAVQRGDPLTADDDGKAVPIDGAGMFQAVVAGEAADTDIAVAGILRSDALVGVSTTDGTAVANPIIHADGQIRSTGTTQNKHLIVTWRRRIHVVGIAEVDGVAGDIGEALIAPGVY